MRLQGGQAQSMHDEDEDEDESQWEEGKSEEPEIDSEDDKPTGKLEEQLWEAARKGNDLFVEELVLCRGARVTAKDANRGG